MSAGLFRNTIGPPQVFLQTTQGRVVADKDVQGRSAARSPQDPDASSQSHQPGEEIIYVLEGSLEYQIEGMPAKTYNAGEALIVPAEFVHAVRNAGEGNGTELGTYIIEKGKPFIVLAED